MRIALVSELGRLGAICRGSLPHSKLQKAKGQVGLWLVEPAWPREVLGTCDTYAAVFKFKLHRYLRVLVHRWSRRSTQRQSLRRTLRWVSSLA